MEVRMKTEMTVLRSVKVSGTSVTNWPGISRRETDESIFSILHPDLLRYYGEVNPKARFSTRPLEFSYVLNKTRCLIGRGDAEADDVKR